MTRKSYDMVLVGVGGQGLMLLSNIIGTAAASSGLKVITAENHGLAQRGGSTGVHLRVGEEVHSPLIPFGCADLLLSMELMEALRYIEYLKEGGTVLSNTRLQHPVAETGSLTGKAWKDNQPLGPDEILSRLEEAAATLVTLNATEKAREAGVPRGENMVLLGAASALEGFPLVLDGLIDAARTLVPPKVLDANLEAFRLGRTAAS